jgi:RimJ/RimL family protein N-acetyltransferase
MTNVAEARALREDLERSRAAGTRFQWGVARRDDDRVVGTLTVFHVDEQHRRAEIGYVLARAAWGHGFAGEAVSRLLDHLFEDHHLYRVEADVDPRNTRSLAVLERLGFLREGVQRGRYHVAGEVQDSVLLGLLGHERP